MTQERPAETDPAPWSSLIALVLGGTGFIGRHVAGALVGRGARVQVMVRPGRSAGNVADLPVEVVAGDLDDAGSLERAFSSCDVIFHCAASYPRSHFGRDRQVARALAQTDAFLRAARRSVPNELLTLPQGHLRLLELEQAQGAAMVVRMQPERASQLRRQIRAPQLLDQALAGRLNASLHPPLHEIAGLQGLKRVVYVSSITTIGKPHGRKAWSGPGEPDGASERHSGGPGGAVRGDDRPELWANESDRHEHIRDSSPYFRMKEEMEAVVTRAAVEGMPIVIANPTFCVDTHDAAPTSGTLLLAVARRGMPFYLPGALNVVAARDVAQALIHAASWGRTGQRYILGGENTTSREFLTLVAEIAGAPPPRAPLPYFIAERVAWITEALNLAFHRPWPLVPVSGVQMMRHSQPVDTRLAHEELRMPRTPIRTAVTDALRWFREHGYL
jgi:nucleoside-diphosphate-sugar epimerase